MMTVPAPLCVPSPNETSSRFSRSGARPVCVRLSTAEKSVATPVRMLSVGCTKISVPMLALTTGLKRVERWSDAAVSAPPGVSRRVPRVSSSMALCSASASCPSSSMLPRGHA